jgi:hypothetical protein
MKREVLHNLTSARTLRLNSIGEAAVDQVKSFFTKYTETKLTNSVLFTLLAADYRNHLTRRMKEVNRLEGEDHQEALRDLIREELQKVEFIQGRD